MDDIRELSDHVREKRERKGRDSALEDLLEYWGAWRANVITGLSASSRSPITIAMEQYKSYPTSNIVQPKQTRVTQSTIPKYWPHHRMSLINQAIWELQSIYQYILIRKYEDLWSVNDFEHNLKWERQEYYNNIRCAKRALKKHKIIKNLLGRA